VCGFFAFYNNYGSILHQFQDKATYWWKIVIFSHILAFDVPVRGYSSEYFHPVWCEKSRMVGIPDGEKNLEDIYNRLDTIPACDGQTDGQTDGHTSYHGIFRAMHTRRAVKNRSYGPEMVYTSPFLGPAFGDP